VKTGGFEPGALLIILSLSLLAIVTADIGATDCSGKFLVSVFFLFHLL